MENYLLRSMLYVPAYKEKFIEKALCEKADALIFDLEDAVPETFKPDARKILKSYIDKGSFKGKMVLVRLNSLKSNHTLEDLRYAAFEDVDGFMVSKITKAEEITFYDELLSKLEAERGLTNGHFKLTVLIETTSAVMDAYRICTASDRVIAACFGGEDYLNDVHGVHSEPPHVFDYPRTVIITAARAAGILPIDSPYLAVHDEEGFMKEERLSYEMGFAGIQVLSPRQLPFAEACFTPSEEEVNYSREVVRVSEEAIRTGAGVAMYQGKLVGPPIRKKAEKVLAVMNLVKQKEMLCE